MQMIAEKMSNTETMMDLSHNKSRDSNLDVREEGSEHVNSGLNCKPKDLSVRAIMRRPKPIPPPLNLKGEDYVEVAFGMSSALKEFAILATGPQSPLMQKNLPFRKRAHSVPDANENTPYSAPPTLLKFFPPLFKQEKAEDEQDCSPPLNLSLPPTPKSFNSRDTGSPPGSSTVTSSTLPELTSKLMSSSTHGTSSHPMLSSGTVDTHHHNMPQQSFTRHHISPWSPFHPTPSILNSHWMNGSPSALLSPAPSSLGSSQEDLRLSHSLPVSTVSNLMYESDPWRLPWPYPVWHCFQLGTLIRFCMNSLDIVVRAEEVNHRSELQFLTPERLGLLRVQCIKPVESPASAVEITFACNSLGLSGDAKLVATCHCYHTFLVMEKGWCAVSPESVLQQYGIQCQPLECGDCCPPPRKMPQVASPGICDKFKRFSFSPEELNSSLSPHPGPLMLSPPNTPTMKNQQSQHSLHPKTKSSKCAKQKANNSQHDKPPSKASNKAPLDPNRPKRPMNAFMLFAKEHRLKLIRMHPGKDNRFVSVILGEAWRQLPADQKEVFITEAKALSHERKRLHPECWKRKRAQSTTVPDKFPH